jgi:hypothetical protein
MTDVVDQEQDRLISKWSSADTNTVADEQVEMWKASVRRHHAKRRERNRWEWVRFLDRMAESHAKLSEDYQRRAEELCRGEVGR